MPPLAPEIVEQLTALLKQRRAELMEHVRSHAAGAGGEPPDIGPAAHMTARDDAPQADMIGDDEARIASHDDSELGAINRQLGRLEFGAAGICLSCGNDITAERLLSSPTAEYCIDCQRERERGAHLANPGAQPTM